MPGAGAGGGVGSRSGSSTPPVTMGTALFPEDEEDDDEYKPDGREVRLGVDLFVLTKVKCSFLALLLYDIDCFRVSSLLSFSGTCCNTVFLFRRQLKLNFYNDIYFLPRNSSDSK